MPELLPLADAIATSPAARQEKGQENAPRLLQVRPLLDAITPLPFFFNYL